MPERIQMRRTKGWRLPPNAVIVSRPTKWENPFVVGTYVIVSPLWNASPTLVLDREDSVRRYRQWMQQSRIRVEGLIPELRGKDLACWCPLLDADGNRVPCHADVLLEWANASPSEGPDA